MPEVTAPPVHPPLAHMRAKPGCYLRKLTPEVAGDIEAGNYRRSSHETPCPICGETSGRHPVVEQHEFLHYLCNGDLVKL
jgi:hypothetical protein